MLGGYKKNLFIYIKENSDVKVRLVERKKSRERRNIVRIKIYIDNIE